jgi:hypothetical protein
MAVEPLVVTVAVNVSLTPFAGAFELAASEVNVEFSVGGGEDEPLEPPPQLATPKNTVVVAR